MAAGTQLGGPLSTQGRPGRQETPTSRLRDPRVQAGLCLPSSSWNHRARRCPQRGRALSRCETRSKGAPVTCCSLAVLLAYSRCSITAPSAGLCAKCCTDCQEPHSHPRWGSSALKGSACGLSGHSLTHRRLVGDVGSTTGPARGCASLSHMRATEGDETEQWGPGQLPWWGGCYGVTRATAPPSAACTCRAGLGLLLLGRPGLQPPQNPGPTHPLPPRPARGRLGHPCWVGSAPRGGT